MSKLNKEFGRDMSELQLTKHIEWHGRFVLGRQVRCEEILEQNSPLAVLVAGLFSREGSLVCSEGKRVYPSDLMQDY